MLFFNFITDSIRYACIQIMYSGIYLYTFFECMFVHRPKIVNNETKKIAGPQYQYFKYGRIISTPFIDNCLLYDICTVRCSATDLAVLLPNREFDSNLYNKSTRYKFLMFEIDVDGAKYDLHLETIENKTSYYVVGNIINYAFIEKLLYDQYKVTINQSRPQIIINIIDDKHISQINRLTMPEQYMLLKENEYQIKLNYKP